MASVDFNQVVEIVKALTPAEQWRLRDLLEVWLAPPEAPMTEEEFEQELLRQGILDHVPPPITDLTPYQHRKPVEVIGKPVSETIIEERR
jgi:hypothetical protein